MLGWTLSYIGRGNYAVYDQSGKLKLVFMDRRRLQPEELIQEAANIREDRRTTLQQILCELSCSRKSNPPTKF